MAKIQQPTMAFLALERVQMNLDLMGWQMAMYRSTVKAVRERAARELKKVNSKLKWKCTNFLAVQGGYVHDKATTVNTKTSTFELNIKKIADTNK
jgi:hypothetical protein